MNTISLAKKFGLVETIHFSAFAKNPKQVHCEFSHLVVIDFESTCWKDKKHAVPEIIEFPAVLLDIATGAILAEFHHYVTPVEIPQLSEFCTQFTGITQNQVESGVPLSTSICLFVQWIKEMRSKHDVHYFALVTWSDWDLNVCLHNECKRKGINKPNIFNRWIDLRALYKEHKQKPPRGLRAAVEDEGLAFSGREHSGIDDARNTARLAWKLYSNGMILRITKNLTAAV